MTRLVLRVVFLLLLLGVSTADGWAQGGITYIYDTLGRLVGVVDPAGDTVVYSYDAVGNILSISRYSSSQVSIIAFNPTSGPVGTSVTIYGTGFSTTPSQNTLTFNGFTATVTSSTTTSIVSSVPSGATTGPIGVTTPSGSATSSTPFTVNASQAPTITGFTPTIALAGTAVTITGTNFETTLANNRVGFNITEATATSATSTSIATSVPGLAGSGRISVTTPNGKATSSQDFFIPPGSFTPADVVFTGRMDIGATSSVTVGTANKIGLMVFDGTAGQQVSLRAPNSTFTQCGVAMALYNPYNASIAYVGCMGGSTGFIDTTPLSTTGTYTILVDPGGTNTGSTDLTLHNVVHVTGPITPGSSAVTVTTTIPGQNALLTFSGTAGQRVSLRTTNASFAQCNLAVAIRKPDGTNLVSNNCMGAGGTGFIDTQTLPTAGTYTVFVDPTAANTGSVTVTLYDVPPDITGPITPGGSPVSLTFNVPGQNALLTFAGTANHRVSLRTTNATMSQCNLDVAIRKPDGTNLASKTCMGSGGAGFIDTQILPVDGTYTVFVNPINATTGSVTVTLFDVPPDISGPITPGGSAVPLNFTVPGQNALLTFAGTANQRVSLHLTNSTMSQCNLAAAIRKPDGTNLVSNNCMGSGSSGFFDTQILPTTGTYTVFVDPTNATTGSVNVTLYDVPDDVTGSITPGGSAVSVTIATPGQNALLTFAGTANQRVSLRATNVTMSQCNLAVTIRKPDGTNLVVNNCIGSGSSGFIDTQTLPTTGTYTVFVNPANATTGSVNITLYDIVDVTGTLTINGGAVPVTITIPGQNAQLTFSGTSGQQVTVRVTSNTMSTVTVKLLKPDGTTLTSSTSSAGSFNLATQTLPTTGTYTVTIDPSGTNTGSMNVSVTSP